uniref:ZM domain-containing protein n=1 Tax=Strongyloides venezuelensis TaxID=75913 RepID=A0A0K0FDH2_STRVS
MKNDDSCELNNVQTSNMNNTISFTSMSNNNNNEIVIKGSEKFPTLLEAIRKVDTPPRQYMRVAEHDTYRQLEQIIPPEASEINATEESKKPLKRKYVRKSKINSGVNECANVSPNEVFSPESPRKRGPKKIKKIESTKIPDSSQFYGYKSSYIRQENNIPETVKKEYTSSNIGSLSRISFNSNFPFENINENVQNTQIDNTIQISPYLPDNYNNNLLPNNTNYPHDQVNYQPSKQIINNTTPSPNFSIYQNPSHYGQNYSIDQNSTINPQIYQPSPKSFVGGKFYNDSKITFPYKRTSSSTPIQHYNNPSYINYENLKRENGVAYSGSGNGVANNLTKDFMNNQANMYNLNNSVIHNNQYTPNNGSSPQNMMAQTFNAQTRHHLNNFPNTLQTPTSTISTLSGGNYINNNNNNINNNNNNFYSNTYPENSQNTITPLSTPTSNNPPNNIFNYQLPKYEQPQSIDKSYYNGSTSTYIPPDTSSSSTVYNHNSPTEEFSYLNKYQYHNQQSSVVYHNTSEVLK